jgi:SAM-dependent methyltransferase
LHGSGAYRLVAMNRFHRRYCGSAGWARVVEHELLPWALDGVALGDDVLEIGPGLGVTTRLLAGRVPRLTALEVDPRFVEPLERELGRPGAVDVVAGDGAAMPFPDDRFSAAVCFTMLHHVPSPELQDRLFAEAHRVLRPGGVFAGSDSQPSLRFRLIHLFDTMVVVDPATLPERLAAAGFSEVEVQLRRSLRFRARKRR